MTVESPETSPPAYAGKVVKKRNLKTMAWLAAISVGFAVLWFAVAANASDDQYAGAAALLGLGSALLAAVFAIIYQRRFMLEFMAQAEPPKGLRLWAMPICGATVVGFGATAMVIWTHVTPSGILIRVGPVLAMCLLLALLNWWKHRLR